MFFNILCRNSEPPCFQTACQNSISKDLWSSKLVPISLGLVERLYNSDFILESKIHVFLIKHLNENEPPKPKNLKKISENVKKSPASNTWAENFKNDDFRALK